MVFREIAQAVPQYGEMSYRSLGRAVEQWPKVGGEDLYYGGTAYDNQSGVGQQWPAAAESSPVEHYEVQDTLEMSRPELAAVQTAALYQPGTLMDKSEVIASRVARPTVFLHADDAQRYAVSDGDAVVLQVNGMMVEGSAHVNGYGTAGTVFLRGTKAVPGGGLIAVEDIQVKE
jgi:predicted molibdopterin-dependent oxidoreductase YjgC